MNKKQCTEGSCCLSTPLTKEQGTPQRRQTKPKNISEVFGIVRKLFSQNRKDV